MLTRRLWSLPFRCSITAPKAKTVPHTITLHGRQLNDEWHWMRNTADPDLRAYLEQENMYIGLFPTHTSLSLPLSPSLSLLLPSFFLS